MRSQRTIQQWIEVEMKKQKHNKKDDSTQEKKKHNVEKKRKEHNNSRCLSSLCLCFSEK